MSRYIDSNKLYIAAMDTEFYDATDEDVVLDLINQQPIADVQEVVRCKNCQHRTIDTFNRTVCVRDFQVINIKDDDFCSYGENGVKE